MDIAGQRYNRGPELGRMPNWGQAISAEHKPDGLLSRHREAQVTCPQATHVPKRPAAALVQPGPR